MQVAKVIGNVWSTKKHDRLHALRMLLVQPLDQDLKPLGEVFLAVDEIGAGNQDLVIVAHGGTAANAALKRDEPVPVDAVVVGIIDSLEVFKKGPGK